MSLNLLSESSLSTSYQKCDFVNWDKEIYPKPQKRVAALLSFVV